MSLKPDYEPPHVTISSTSPGETIHDHHARTSPLAGSVIDAELFLGIFKVYVLKPDICPANTAYVTPEVKTICSRFTAAELNQMVKEGKINRIVFDV